jgi:hypothetical protein
MVVAALFCFFLSSFLLLLPWVHTQAKLTAGVYTKEHMFELCPGGLNINWVDDTSDEVRCPLHHICTVTRVVAILAN